MVPYALFLSGVPCWNVDVGAGMTVVVTPSRPFGGHNGAGR